MRIFIEILKNNYRLAPVPLIIFIIMDGLSNIVFLIAPKIIERLIHILETRGDIDQFYFYLLILVIIIVVGIGLWLIAENIATYSWIKTQIKRNLFYLKKLFKTDFANLTNQGTGKLLTKINRWVQAEVDSFFSIINIVISLVSRAILTLVIIFIIYPFFGLVFAGLFIFSLSLNYFFYKKLTPLAKEENKVRDNFSRNTTKIVMETMTIKLSNRQDFEIEKSDKISSKLPYLGFKIDLYANAPFNIIHLGIRLLELLIYLIVGGAILKNGEYSIAFLTMLTTYVIFLWQPLNILIYNVNRITRNLAKYNHLQEFINLPNKIIDGQENFKYKNGEIDFQNIDFDYQFKKEESRYILQNFSLKIKAGETTALVGHSGSGKSTIVKLILRLYDPQTGKILVDGQNLKDLKISSFYQYVGYLSQEPSIFDGTIRENLEYAFNQEKLINYEDELVWQALEKADIKDLIEKMPKKLETEIGEKGVKLSGGEKQRLAMARIFLKNPKILILDEPTSALDSLSESKITKVLNDIIKDRTVIIIAHRLQTVMQANQIVVIENGEIDNIGTHQQLLKKSAIYQKLVDLQHGVINE